MQLDQVIFGRMHVRHEPLLDHAPLRICCLRLFLANRVTQVLHHFGNIDVPLPGMRESPCHVIIETRLRKRLAIDAANAKRVLGAFAGTDGEQAPVEEGKQFGAAVQPRNEEGDEEISAGQQQRQKPEGLVFREASHEVSHSQSSRPAEHNFGAPDEP